MKKNLASIASACFFVLFLIIGVFSFNNKFAVAEDMPIRTDDTTSKQTTDLRRTACGLDAKDPQFYCGPDIVIATCEELQLIGNDVDYPIDANYVMNADVDCSATNPNDSDNDGSSWEDGSGFNPIGSDGAPDNPFTGTFDGNGHNITSLYINRPNTDFVGLFATIDSGATVHDLGLTDVDITGFDSTGALVGSLSGTVENVHISGFVSGEDHTGGIAGRHINSNSWYNSSPLVYTWNGDIYKYVADVGNLLPKEVTSPADAATIDKGDLVPKNGKYSMKISEEYNEIVYYDELSLSTYDHAPGYSIAVPLNRNATAADVKTVSDTSTNPLLSCTDASGNNCLNDLKNNDDKWAYTGDNFVNSYVLDFGDLSNKDNIQLVMRTARDYEASAKKRADGTYQSLRTIAVKNAEGAWVEIYNKNDLGSDGTPRLRTIDLTGKFLTNDYHVKVGFDTMYVNYFAVDTAPQVPVTVSTYHPTKANLGLLGFTEISKIPYINHDYSKVSSLPAGMFKGQYGNFTKYGNVSPLLESTNDQFVIMHYGDQMDIEFPYVAPADGMERSFVLNNVAYYKHASNESIGLLGKTVTPLPYQGMTDYTVETNGYPMTPENTAYLSTWNTRAIEGTPRVDTVAGSTIINSYSSADVYGDWSTGGLVGYNEKEIRNSYASGNVYGTNWRIGGLVGNNGDDGSVGWIHDSFATGSVTGTAGEVGGLVGYNYGIVEKSYSTGAVSGGEGDTQTINGLIGYNCDGCGSTDVNNVFWDNQTSGQAVDNGYGAGTPKTTSQMKSITTFTDTESEGLDSAWDFTGTQNDDAGTDDIWGISLSSNNGYPMINGLSYETPELNYFTPSLIGWWKLDEKSGTTAKDSSDTENDGSVDGAAKWVSGKIDNAFSFNAITQIQIDRPAQDNFSICAWIKTAAVGVGFDHYTGMMILDSEVGGSAADFGFGVDAEGYLMYGDGGNGDETVIGETGVSDNEWHLTCVTRNARSGLASLYVDGALDTSGTTSRARLNDNSIALIGYPQDGGAGFDGLIDDVRVYGGVLSGDDISDLYEEGLAHKNRSGGSLGGSTTIAAHFFATQDDAENNSHNNTPTTDQAIPTISEIQKVIKDLKFGMTDSDVSILQQFLIDQNKGPAALALKAHGVTNFFGKLTQAALAEWQKVNGITPAAGYFGPKTRASIKAQNL